MWIFLEMKGPGGEKTLANDGVALLLTGHKNLLISLPSLRPNLADSLEAPYPVSNPRWVIPTDDHAADILGDLGGT